MRAFLTLVLVVVIGGCGPTIDANGLQIIDARVNVKQAVMDRLKDPNSASFPGYVDFKRINDDEFTTSGSVDAKNGFGGTIRTPFSATVDKLGNVKRVNVGG